MRDIVGIGAAVFDTLITLPQYPTEDTKLRAEGTKSVGGGPAATGIVAAAKLGESTGFIGVLSSDAGGQYLLKDFEKYGVDTSTIDVQDGYRSFSSCIWLSRASTSRTCVFDKGDLPPLKLNDRQKQAIREAKVLMVDGNELSAAVEAAKIARESGTLVLYDAGGLYAGIEELLPYVDILIPSEEYALGITGEKTAEKAAERLMEKYHPKMIAVTQGKRGGILLCDGTLTAYPIYDTPVVDSNGAGDVFHGAFAAALVKGYSYLRACHYSSAVSGLKCTGVGARESVPTHEETLAFLRRNGYDI